MKKIPITLNFYLWLIFALTIAEGQSFQEEAVVWQSFMKTSASSSLDGPVLQRSAVDTAGNAWDADAISTKFIHGDGYISWRFKADSKGAIIGLASTNANRTWTSFHAAVRCFMSGTKLMYDLRSNGLVVSSAPMECTKNDIFRIRRDGTTLVFQKNGAQVGPTLYSSQGPLLVDTSFSFRYSGVVNARIFGRPEVTDVTWQNLVGTSASYLTGGSGSRLTRSSSTGGESMGAISFDSLAGDGEVRFRFGQVRKRVSVGLSQGAASANLSSAMIVGVEAAESGDYFSIIENGVIQPDATLSYEVGEVIALKRTGSMVYLLIDGEQVYEFATQTDASLRVNTSMKNANSFIDHCQVVGASAMESIIWKSYGDSIVKFSPNGSAITRGVTSANWTSGARSAKSLPEMGYIKFSFGRTNARAAAGLCKIKLEGAAGFQDLDYGIVAESDGNAYSYNKTTARKLLGPILTTDTFTIRRVGSNIEYLRNETVLDAETAATGELSPKVCLHDPESSVLNATIIGAASDLLWWNQNATIPSASTPGEGSVLSRNTSAAGWTADAQSAQVLLGSGFLQWTVPQSNLRGAVGFSATDVDTNFSNLLFGFDFLATGKVKILINGAALALNIDYLSGDTFRVRRKSGNVTFYKVTLDGDEVELHRHIPAYTGPLIADCALYSPNFKIVNCQFFNSDADGDGISDKWEVDHGLDPFAAGDAEIDPDRDGRSNILEFFSGSDPNSSINYDIQRDRTDSDGDGASDLVELLAGTDPANYSSQPSARVTMILPRNSSASAYRDKPILIYFDNPLPNEYGLSNLLFDSSSGQPVLGAAQVLPDRRVISYLPEAPLESGKWYNVILSSDISGVEIGHYSRFQVSQVGDPIGPFVANSAPLPRAINVSPYVRIWIAWNEPLDMQTLNTTNVKLEGPEGPVPISLEFDYWNNVLKAIPQVELKGESDYSLKVSTVVRNLNGVTLRNPYSLKFSTRWVPGVWDPVEPGPYISEPYRFGWLLYPDQSIEVPVSETLDPATVDSTSVIVESAGSAVTCEVWYNETSRTISINPLTPWVKNSGVKISFSQQIKSTNGEPMRNNESTSYFSRSFQSPEEEAGSYMSSGPGELPAGSLDSGTPSPEALPDLRLTFAWEGWTEMPVGSYDGEGDVSDPEYVEVVLTDPDGNISSQIVGTTYTSWGGQWGVYPGEFTVPAGSSAVVTPVYPGPYFSNNGVPIDDFQPYIYFIESPFDGHELSESAIEIVESDGSTVSSAFVPEMRWALRNGVTATQTGSRQKIKVSPITVTNFDVTRTNSGFKKPGEEWDGRTLGPDEAVAWGNALGQAIVNVPSGLPLSDVDVRFLQNVIPDRLKTSVVQNPSTQYVTRILKRNGMKSFDDMYDSDNILFTRGGALGQSFSVQFKDGPSQGGISGDVVFVAEDEFSVFLQCKIKDGIWRTYAKAKWKFLGNGIYAPWTGEGDIVGGVGEASSEKPPVVPSVHPLEWVIKKN